MELSTKVAYNTIIQMASKVISTALGLAAVAIMTRYLGQNGFGQYTTVMTFLSYFAILADLGLTLVTVQMISQPQVDQEKILGNLLGLRLISALIILSFAPLAVIFFPYEPIIKLGIVVTTISFLFIALNQIFVGLFQKHLRLDKVSVAEIVSRLILVLGVVLAVKLNYGLLGILLATIATNAVSFLLHYLFSLSLARLKLCFDLTVWRQILEKTWPLAITIFFNLIYLKTDTLLLSILKRPSKIGIIAEVGLYGAAYKVIDVLVTFPFIFAGIVLPILTSRWAANKKDDFNNILQKSFNVMAIFALPLVIGAQLLAKPIMILIAGEQFADSGPVLQILILAAGLIFLGCIFSHAIIAIDKQKKIISAYIFVALTSLVGYLIFIPRFSYFGAAYVTIYSELTIALASFWLVWKYGGFLPKTKIIFQSLAASLVMVLAIYLCQSYITANIFTVLLFDPLVYFIGLYLLGGISQKDLIILLNKK